MTFSGGYVASQREEFERVLAEAPGMTKRELDSATASAKKHIEELSARLKPTQPLEYYVRLAERARTTIPPKAFVYMPVWQFKRAFRNAEQALTLSHLPEHASILVDPHGIIPRGTPREVRIIEAALFEDMCALFNRAWSISEESKQPDASKRVIKESSAMRRATVLAAFYLVEAYLNSIAFDHLVRKGNTATLADLTRITEWDEANRKQKLVAFRDKLLHYPRIILQLQSPPIQENNSVNAKYLLSEAKLFRDAIVHANPRPNRETLDPAKELRFWQIGSPTPINVRRGGVESPDLSGEWIAVVDAAIGLIREIESLLYGGTQRLFWLHSRGKAGDFDDSVFE